MALEPWALHIMEIRQQIQAGCVFGPDDLVHAEWRALGVLEGIVADLARQD